MTEEIKKRLSLDEILDLVSGVARDEAAGADRFRALKMLASMESAAVVLPVPLTDAEVIERIGRIMKSAGATLCQIAYRQVFPRTRQGELAPRLMLGDLPDHVRDQASRCTSLKMLYHVCPEVKRSGMPPGFPQRGSLMAKQEWCQGVAAKILLDREQSKVDETPGPRAES
jgi:hypothetical protein